MANNQRFFFALLSVGAAIGIGNIFVLPYFEFDLSAMFFIQYSIALIVLGAPLLMLEFSAGQFFDRNAVDLFASIRKGFGGIGWLMVFNAFIVMCIYAVALAWHLIYFFVSFGLQWKSSPREYFFSNVLQISGFGSFAEFSLPVFIALAISCTAIFFSIRKGYETAKKAFLGGVAVIAALMLLLLFYSLTLDNALEGVYSFLKPSFSEAFDLKNWLAAFSIAVLSLGISYGIMLSFARKIKNGFVVANSFIVIASELLVSVSLSLILFSLFGFLNARQRIGSLAFNDYGSLFITLTQALPLLYKPTLLSIIFFAFLASFFMLAASALAYSVVYVLVHKFSARHVQASILVCGSGFLLGLLFVIRPGYYIMDIVIHFIYYNILIALLLEAFAIGWFFNSEKIAWHINKYSIIKIGALWRFMIRYVTPSVLLLLLFFQLKSDLFNKYNNYPIWALLVFGAGIVAIPILAAFLMPRRILDRK